MSKFDKEQAEINIYLSQALKDICAKYSLLENKFRILEETLHRTPEQPDLPTLGQPELSKPEKPELPTPGQSELPTLRQPEIYKPDKPELRTSGQPELPGNNVSTLYTEKPVKHKKKKPSPKSPVHQVIAPVAPVPPTDLLAGPTDTSKTSETETRTPSKPNTTAIEGDDWIEHKKRRNRSSVNRVFGTARPGTTYLEAAERVKFIHLYYVKIGTTKEQVLAYLESMCGSGTCTVETLNARGNYASFKLGVPSTKVESVMSPENWAEDICVKPWRQNFRTRSGQN
ncbi:hypothetical protein O0L34_g8805 [Tuta absoluta]|nr:hypothetical protein O0L34_g8805 [Tuta absoluta]